LVVGSRSVLDLDTGGGEVFSRLAPFPERAVAIEDYQPNVAIARRRLAPLGVEVLEASASEQPLPLKDASFDLAVNRHGALDLTEVARLLRPGGQFLTQQVGGDDLGDLIARFGATPKLPGHTLANVGRDARVSGLSVLCEEDWRGLAHFGDVGAIVYFLRACPWLVDGFSVDRHLGALESLQAELARTGRLSFLTTRFLLHAEKT
jgi:SAM-dependent methyltransferase